MRALVVYETTYGNTEQIALAMGDAIGADVVAAGSVIVADLVGYDLLLIGSPTHGGTYTEGIEALFDASPALKGIPVAAFDTRLKWARFGYAASKIAQGLEEAGAQLVVPSEGFLVAKAKGPLREDKLERAVAWAKGIKV